MFDIYEGKHEGQRKIRFNRAEMEGCFRKAEEVLAFSRKPFELRLETIEYEEINGGEDIDPIGFYHAIEKAFYLPTRVWNSLALHESIHARMDAEGLLLLREESSERWATYARIVDETVAELGVHFVMPLNMQWFLRCCNRDLYDLLVPKIKSGEISPELVEREQGEPIDGVIKRWKVYSDAVSLAEFHGKLERDYNKNKDPKKLDEGLREIDRRISLWDASGYSAAGEECYVRTLAIRNTLELSASSEVPMVLSARIRDAMKRGLSARETYFQKIVSNKKKEIKISLK